MNWIEYIALNGEKGVVFSLVISLVFLFLALFTKNEKVRRFLDTAKYYFILKSAVITIVTVFCISLIRPHSNYVEKEEDPLQKSIDSLIALKREDLRLLEYRKISNAERDSIRYFIGNHYNSKITVILNKYK